MKKFLSFLILLAFIVGCGQKQPPREEPIEPINTLKNLPGDSTLYGLACDGCTDSILVLLPFTGETLTRLTSSMPIMTITSMVVHISVTNLPSSSIRKTNKRL